jgi:D-amino peptidase
LKPPARIGLVLALLAAAASPLAAQGKRIFVSVDMEGLAGVVTTEQLGPTGFEYARFREFMTEETLAALAGAREGGATEFVVADSHGNMQNLLLERLPRDVTLVRGTPRALGMMDGIDEGRFDGVIFIGYHASTTNPHGVRAHTMSSANLADVRLNGTSVPEGAWNAALAGHFGVPVLMVAGDDAAVAEVQKHMPGIEGAVVKWNLGFHAARTLTPEAARELIREKARAAVSRSASLKPLRVKTPVDLEIRFKNYRPAEVLAWLRGVERIDAHAVRYQAQDMPEAARFLAFALNYQANLEP